MENKINKKLCWLHLWSALRNFYNGAFSSSLLYFFLYCIAFKSPISISLMIAAAIFANMVKIKLIAFVEKKSQIYGLLLTYLFYFAPLMVLHYFNFHFLRYNVAPISMIIVGLFPVNGQDITIFKDLQTFHICNTRGNEAKQINVYVIPRIAYIFQALGSVSAFLYMIFKIQEVDFIDEARVRQVFIFIYFIALINILFYTFFFLEKILKKNQEEKKIKIDQDDNSKLKNFKILNMANGFTFGLVSAPIITYFLDIKLSLYHDKVGLLMFAFYLFKGMGQEWIKRQPKMNKFFLYWSVISNFTLCLIAFFPMSSFSLLCFIISLPVWNYNKIRLQQRIISQNKSQQIKSSSEIMQWQSIGVALGIFISSFQFSTLYSKTYFGYSFFLCGLIKQILLYFLNDSEWQKLQENEEILDNQIKIQSYTRLQILDSSVIDPQQQNIEEDEKINGQMKVNKSQKRQRHLVYAILVLTLLIIGYAISIFTYSCYFTGTCKVLRVKSYKFEESPLLSLHNYSLAHYLVRQNIINIKLANCDQQCNQYYSKRTTDYYDKLIYDHQTPQWIHFAQMPYFTSEQEIINNLALISNLSESIKGISMVWSNPLRYNKIPDELHDFIIDFCQSFKLYYVQMPSLNLRGVENKIIFIFRRTKRQTVKLPPFIKKQPPSNQVAIQTNLKMISNHLFLRQFILYHLNLGVDKFFLYNNDKEYSDPDFYKENRDTGNVTSKCFNATLDGQMAFFEELWQQFYDHIIYVPWRNGVIRAQGEAHLHYTSFYRHVATFTSMTDLDQFIFSPSGQYLPETLSRLLHDHQISALQLVPRTFKSRVCLNNQIAIEQYRWTEQKGFLSVKTVVMTKMLVDHEIHDLSTKNGVYAYINDPRHDLMIYHYKKTSISNEGDQQVWKIDDSMKIYVKELKDSCKDKCSDNVKLTCSQEKYQEFMKIFCGESGRLLKEQ